LQSFVSDRSQYIAIGLERSATTELSSGVPQGSILGPLLFAIYVSPIDDVVCAHQMQYHQYADDLILYTALVPSMFSDLSSIADCTDAVSTWSMENALLLNPAKTEAVQGRIMVPPGPEARTRLRAPHTYICNIDVILVLFLLLPPLFRNVVYVKKQLFLTCSKTTQVGTLYTWNYI